MTVPSCSRDIRPSLFATGGLPAKDARMSMPTRARMHGDMHAHAHSHKASHIYPAGAAVRIQKDSQSYDYDRPGRNKWIFSLDNVQDTDAASYHICVKLDFKGGR